MHHRVLFWRHNHFVQKFIWYIQPNWFIRFNSVRRGIHSASTFFIHTMLFRFNLLFCVKIIMFRYFIWFDWNLALLVWYFFFYRNLLCQEFSLQITFYITHLEDNHPTTHLMQQSVLFWRHNHFVQRFIWYIQPIWFDTF